MKSEARKISVSGQRFAGEMTSELLDGLSQTPKRIAAKYFYDQRGSELFNAITELKEYYIPRVEQSIFARHKLEICAEIGKAKTVVEPGAGSCEKIKWLLPELSPSAYIPMDISGSHLQENATELSKAYPGLTVNPLIYDHSNGLLLSDELPGSASVFFYPGSSIGNFEPEAAVGFMRELRTKMGGTGGLLIGVDSKKDPNVLHAAYNDCKGVTAAFNLNVLHHLNQLLDGNLNPGYFEHLAFYNKEQGRIEMHLRCLKDHREILAGTEIEFSAGELINTEFSYKYYPEEFSALAHRSGLRLKRLWQDEQLYFSVMYFVPE